MPPEAYLARYALADLFLDTLPYNAHATACDALWAGLPVLTCAQGSYAGRVAASLLHAVGLPELVTQTPEDYEALAVELARDPRKLSHLRAKLAANRLSTPLFDTPRFTRDLEEIYTRFSSTDELIHETGAQPGLLIMGAAEIDLGEDILIAQARRHRDRHRSSRHSPGTG